MDRRLFHSVHIFAARVKAVARIPFGVLVGQQIAHGELDGQRGVVFRGDQFEVGPLVLQLLDNRLGDHGKLPLIWSSAAI